MNSRPQLSALPAELWRPRDRQLSSATFRQDSLICSLASCFFPLLCIMTLQTIEKIFNYYSLLFLLLLLTVSYSSIFSPREEQALISSNNMKPVVKLLINRHNNKYSYTGASDDNLLKVEIHRCSSNLYNRLRRTDGRNNHRIHGAASL